MNKKTKERYPVKIVGAGPGDPGLLTVKAYRSIEEADVLLYDCLPAVHVTEVASSKTVVRFIDKHNEDPARRVDMLDVLEQYYNEGKKIVRLKAGDALMFNGGGYEAKKLKERGVPFEIIPGITAGTAGSNLFAIPLNEKGETNATLYLIADQLDDRVGLIRSAARMMRDQDATVVLYMAYDHLREIFALFEEEGLISDLPVVATSMISLSDEDCVEGTMQNILQKMESREMVAPFTFFIGKYVTHYLSPKSQAERDLARITQMC
ncbi:MAG: Uroporphyrin-III C/tetrapyrrole (Corrin/Porphyrin) methyltransferase [Bacteroidetes bacterium]|nr:Uroporphyrin-III C/tetrapyrrole (Corrin/Porphyrin) methyltransferase [Bacteroidota bacterium]